MAMIIIIITITTNWRSQWPISWMCDLQVRANIVKKPSGNNPRALASHEKLSSTPLPNDNNSLASRVCPLDDPSKHYIYKKQFVGARQPQSNSTSRAGANAFPGSTFPSTLISGHFRIPVRLPNILDRSDVVSSWA